VKQNIALSVVSVFLSLLLIEAGARILQPIGYQPFFDTSSEEWKHDSADLPTLIKASRAMGYELIPRRGSGGYKVNSLGIFDRERTIEKKASEFRIIALGDSITGGGGMTYVKFIEDALKDKTGHIEIWNCGVPGYNTAQELAFLQQRCINFKPDLVLLQFCLNDFQVTPVVIKDKGRPVVYWPRNDAAGFINPLLFKYSYLYRRIIFFLYFRENFDEKEKCYRIVKESLTRMRDLLAERGVSFFVAVFPYMKDPYNEQDNTRYAYIREIIRDLHITSLDLTPTFLNAKVTVGELSIGDGLHPNVKGHELAANVILKEMFKRNLLPSGIQKE